MKNIINFINKTYIRNTGIMLFLFIVLFSCNNDLYQLESVDNNANYNIENISFNEYEGVSYAFIDTDGNLIETPVNRIYEMIIDLKDFQISADEYDNGKFNSSNLYVNSRGAPGNEEHNCTVYGGCGSCSYDSWNDRYYHNSNWTYAGILLIERFNYDPPGQPPLGHYILVYECYYCNRNCCTISKNVFIYYVPG